MKNWMTLFAGVAALALTVGCGHHDHDHENHENHGHDNHGHGESTVAEACEHMADGPNSTTTAGATAEEAVDTDTDTWLHKRNDIELTADGDQFVGYLTFEVSTAGDHEVFTDGAVELSIGDATVSAASEVSECTEVEFLYDADLPVGEHLMTIRADRQNVQLVIEYPKS